MSSLRTKNPATKNVSSGKMAVLPSNPGLNPSLIREQITEVSMERKKGKVWLSFPVEQPGFTMKGLLRCNLTDYSTDRFDFSIYRIEAVQHQADEFLLLINYVWKNIRQMENFEAVARFTGRAPAELNARTAP